MKRTFAACLLSAALPLSSALLAQDPPQPPEGSAPSSPPAGNANDTGTGSREMRIIEASKKLFLDLRDKCCKQFNIGCDVLVNFDDSAFSQPDKASKSEYTNDSDSIKLLDKVTGDQKNLVTIPVLFTNNTIVSEGEDVGGIATAGFGALVSVGGSMPSALTMSHEIGHSSGYYQLNYRKDDNEKNPSLKDRVDKDRSDRSVNLYSNLKNDIMHKSTEHAGSEVDKCYCRKVFGTHFFPLEDERIR